MNREFIIDVSRSIGTIDYAMVKKDAIIHRLLAEIASDEHLSERLVFKGGTCLVKAHLSYYRFSDDIDFGWADGRLWKDRSKRSTESSCLVEIKKVIERMTSIASRLEMAFDPALSSRNDVFVSNTGTKVTFHLHYAPAISPSSGKIKMEINLVDLILHRPLRMSLSSLLDRVDARTRYVHHEDVRTYGNPVRMLSYPKEEILIEKCRAAMTRGQYKIRDTIDLAMLKRRFDMDIFDFEGEIEEKLRFTVDRFQRYREAFNEASLPEDPDELEKDMNLLIIPRPSNLMNDMVDINKHLNQLKNDMCKKMKTV